jgi:FMN phosphatase YigB (HAD superfamily)
VGKSRLQYRGGRAVIGPLDAIRWVFFDVGDTLMDESVAGEHWHAHVSSLLGERGFERSPADVGAAREQAWTDMAEDLYLRIFENLGVPPEVGEEIRPLIAPQREHERPFPGAGDVLRDLAARYRIGIIANQPEGTLERLCSQGWGDLISVCISSTEEGLSKPDARIFHLALERAGCSAEEAVMIGDRLDNDVRPARALGMRTIRIRQGPARHQAPRDPQDEPDATVDDILELRTLLLED